jgi:hypothetical protein
MRAAIGAESFEPTWMPLGLQVLCWAVCGCFAGIATCVSAAAFRSLRRGRRQLPATLERAHAEFDPQPPALQIAEPRPPQLRVPSLKRSGLSAWATSIFLHLVALWLVTICFVPFRRTQEEWVLHVTWVAPPEADPIDHAVVPKTAGLLRSSNPFEIPRTPQSEPLPHAKAGDGGSSVNADLLFGRKERDPIRPEDEGGRFSFNVYSPTVLATLNRLCERAATQPDKEASVSVVATSLTQNPKSGEPCHFSVKVQNRGKAQLTDLFVLAEFGNDLSIEATAFGGISVYRSNDVLFPDFVASNGSSSGTNLIGFDYGPNRLIRHVRGLKPGEWVQFVVAVRPKRSAKYRVRAAVISEQHATAQNTTTVSVRE